MRILHAFLSLVILISALLSRPLCGQEASATLVELSPFHVYAGSSGSSSAPAIQLSERMSREVRVDLQSRGGNRYQSDISIRGGIFEGTSLMIGGMALFDPQTGHYFSEIPLDPAFFGGAFLLTGVDNAVWGFNSTAGAIDWQWAPLRSGGSAYLRAGTDAYLGAGLRAANGSGKLRYEVSVMREAGDGSVDRGDFDLNRVSARMETDLGEGTLRLFGGHLDKFYGWPGMYTGFALNETDEYSVSLLGWQWETGSSSSTRHRVGGYWRQVDDDYEFSRESPNAFFEHKTQVISLQGDGSFQSEAMEWIYRWALVSDRILRSTSLTNGDFNERDYGEAALLGSHRWDTDWGEVHLYGGAAVQATDEDGSTANPQLGISASGVREASSWRAYIEYAATSQVPGYTALNSAPSGLFGGNKDLERERASTIEGGLSFDSAAFSGTIVAFFRRDRGLVDWVYDSATPTARQAAPVDLDVGGLECWASWRTAAGAIEAGYIWLDKASDYGTDAFDASFYALNYARHRLLLSWSGSVGDFLQVRLEGEFRKHPQNALRRGGDEALLLHAELVVKDQLPGEWQLVFRVNNLTKESFQPLPGTPGPGREAFLTLSRDW